MEDALEPIEEEEYTLRPNKQFVLWLAASLCLHLILAAVLLGLPGGGGAPPRPAVTYVDLKSIPAPAAPAVKPQPEPIPQPMKSDEEAEPLPETPPAKELPQAAQQVAPPAPPPTPAQAAVEDTKSSFGVGLTKGYFKALSDGDTLRPDIKEYYLSILQGVNERWWLEQKDNHVRTIMVNLIIARSGQILSSSIMMSSGNLVYDRAVQKMLESAGPLPPVPDTYVGDVFMAPIRLVPPLNLMSW